jgi:hypothetical protein
VKSEAEICRHLADIERALRRPCDCSAESHGVQCHIGGLMMRASADLLRWLLDANPDYDRVVERFAARRL